MRHQKRSSKLGRKSAQRKALNKILACNLLLNEKIKTTIEKAKFTQPLVEKLITLSKEGESLSAKRKIRDLINNREIEKKLIKEIGPKYKEREGGYTRIIKLNERKGDNALVAQIELV
ncbi:MAG: 50S ribosomal protein L17 [Parcubacteria group bacterium]|nr:50S ribosomal protein L17 [Parcubacteria group bacterium]